MKLHEHPGERPVDRWFSNYSHDHRHPTNRSIHLLCVPAIFWSVLALLWLLPGPVVGLWAGMAMAAAWAFYLKLSVRLGMGMGVALLLSAGIAWALQRVLGGGGLLGVATITFVAAWVGQFVGHKLEGRKPSFLTDLTYLLIGPGWVLAKLYRRVGAGW